MSACTAHTHTIAFVRECFFFGAHKRARARIVSSIKVYAAFFCRSRSDCSFSTYLGLCHCRELILCFSFRFARVICYNSVCAHSTYAVSFYSSLHPLSSGTLLWFGCVEIERDIFSIRDSCIAQWFSMHSQSMNREEQQQQQQQQPRNRNFNRMMREREKERTSERKSPKGTLLHHSDCDRSRQLLNQSFKYFMLALFSSPRNFHLSLSGQAFVHTSLEFRSFPLPHYFRYQFIAECCATVCVCVRAREKRKKEKWHFQCAHCWCLFSSTETILEFI